MTVTAETRRWWIPSSKQIGGNVTSQELNDIPSINRNFTTYLGTLPGVTAFISTDSFGADSIRINGQGTQNVNYTLDGAGNNDTFNGGNGGAQARTPVEAVQEFQLLTSQFDAEFGASSGGVVNAVSKSGTNALHGTAFFFNANDDMTAQQLLCGEAEPGEARDAADAVGRQRRRSDHQGQAPFLRQPRAHRSEPRHHASTCRRGPSSTSPTSRTTTCGTGWPAMDHQINATNTWAVRWLRETSPQSNQFPGVTNWTQSRAEKETDTDWTDRRHAELGDREHQGQHLEALVHEGRRVLRQPRVLRHRRSGAVRSRGWCSRRTRTASARARTAAWTRPISSTRRSRGSCPARRATTT